MYKMLFTGVTHFLTPSAQRGQKLTLKNGVSVVFYVSFAFGNLVAPSIISVLKPKKSLIISSATYVLYISMFLYPSNILLYSLSGLGCPTI